MIRQGLILALFDEPTLAGEIKPLPIAGNPRAIVPGAGIDLRPRIDRRAPATGGVPEADEDIRTPVTPLSSEASEQDVAFIGRNGGLEGVDPWPVEDGTQVLGLFVFAVLEFRPKYVVLGGFT